MCPSDYITSKEALQVLGLYDPAKHKRAKIEVLSWLEERGLLEKIKINARVVKYRRIQCENLFERHIKERLSLTINPNPKKQAA